MFNFNLDENWIASEHIISVYLDLIPVDFLYVGSKNKICSVRKFQFNFKHYLTKQNQGTRFWIECHSGVTLRELALVIFWYGTC